MISTFKERITAAGLDADLVKKVLEIDRQWRWDLHYKICGICHKPLPANMVFSPLDYTNCCPEHKQYKGHYQVDLVRKELGITVTDLYDL